MSDGGYGGPTGHTTAIRSPPIPIRSLRSFRPHRRLLVTRPIRSPPCRWYSHSSSPLWARCSAISGCPRSGAPGNGAATGPLIGLTLSYAFILIAVAALVIWAVVGMEPERSSTVATSPPL